MKKILDINFSRLNKMEQLLRNLDFYKKYKIGVVPSSKRGLHHNSIQKLTLGKNYVEGKYILSNLELLPIKITDDYNEIFGYDDQCGKNYQERHCVLSEDQDSYIMTVNNEQISGPYTEGYQRYEYGDGNTPMNEFAYGVINSRLTVFKIPKSLSIEEMTLEINKILETNYYYYSAEFREKREQALLLKKKKEKMEALAYELEELEKEKIKKTEKYLNLKKELGL